MQTGGLHEKEGAIPQSYDMYRKDALHEAGESPQKCDGFYVAPGNHVVTELPT